jgi:hypothetical protein
MGHARAWVTAAAGTDIIVALVQRDGVERMKSPGVMVGAGR